MIERSHDDAAIAAFIRDYLGGHIHLVSILPDNEDPVHNPRGRWFEGDYQAATEWAASENAAGRNLYWTLNITNVAKKPTKADITGIRGFGIDVDPDGPEWNKQAALADLIMRGQPSYVIDSGRGLQAVWLTQEAGLTHEQVEQVNRGLSAAFAGDATFNVDRLYRLPGTLNHGDAKKRAAGYGPTVASLIVPFTGAVHTSSDLLARFPAPVAPVTAVTELPIGPRPEWTLGHLDDDKIVETMLRERPNLAATFGEGPSISDLWDGTDKALTHHNGDASAADLGLMSKVAFYAGCDPERMDRIFRMSALGKRDKWVKRADYRQMTIATAIAGCANVYSQPQTTLSLTEPLRGDIVPANDPLPIAELSHVELADAVVHFLGSRWRYVPDWQVWLRWDGNRWCRDTTIHNEVAQVCQAAARKQELATPGTKRSMASWSAISGVTKLAQANPAVIAKPEQFDADAWLLATPGGIIDLRTGELRSSRPDDLVSMQAAVTPADAEDCPTWLAFLNQVTGGDDAFSAYLKRLAGYSLTGITSEQQLWILHGPGGNGKGVFTNVLSGLMGDYAKTATPETFINTKNNQHLTFIASLEKKRLVTVPEMPSSVSWNLSRVKQMTGEDAIEANRMRADPFEFRATFKLLFSCNEAPTLTDADNAVRRRFRFVPFETVISEAQRDKHLGDKLRAEWPSILRWAINGCLEWQALGDLRAPDVVNVATDSMIDADDHIGQWLNDVSEVDRDGWISTSDMTVSYFTWAATNHAPPMTAIQIGKKVRRRGMMPKKDNGARGWQGRSFNNAA